MLKNYFKTAFRNLARRKGNSLVNIAGLTVGFAAFLAIFLVVQYEESFDTFHKNKDMLYRVGRAGKHPTERDYRTGVPVPVTDAIRRDYPQLTNVCAITLDGDAQVIVPAEDGSPAKKFKEGRGCFFVQPQFFQMFDFTLAAGDIKTALNAPNTALLAKQMAIKYFGDWKTAIGKTIKMDGQNIKVTGILNDAPVNTDFPIKAAVSYATLQRYMDVNNWNSIYDQNYCLIQLPPGYTPERFQPLLNQFTDKYIRKADQGYDLLLQPLNTIHFDSRFGNYNGRTFSKDLILALNLIGLFLLIVACVNFINLTTAQAVNRAREVGVRKVLGSRRPQLIIQFLGETGITCLAALVVAAAIVSACITPVDNLLNIKIDASVLYSGKLVTIMLGVWLCVTVLSGFYPAMVLSGFNPVSVLKGVMAGGHKNGATFRRALVVFQFVIAQALIIATLVVASQMDYFRNTNLGFNKQAIINANFPGDSAGISKMDALRSDLLKMPGVESISFSTATPATYGGNYTDLSKAENHTKQADMVVSIKQADTGFFRMYQLPLVAGRYYRSSDTASEYVVNETLVRKLGLKPNDAIGKMVRVGGVMYPIVGVLKDFHANSLRDPIDAIVMSPQKTGYYLVNLKVNMRQANNIIAAMGDTWNKYFPEFTFQYSFLDDDIAAFYKQENQLSTLYKIFAGIAIFISCLGLYGLISFMAIQRKKEIGIRKVLGAPVRDIVVMLSKEFTILIIIAFVIATPIAWYFMQQWLQHYTYRIVVDLWFFAATITGSLCIAWLTVGYTAIRAALANPVNSLRTE